MPLTGTNKKFAHKFVNDYSLVGKQADGTLKRAVKNEIRNALRCQQELKAVTLSNSFTCTTSPVTSQPTAITQGTDIANRIGDKIEVRKCSFKIKVTPNAAGAAQQMVRMIVFQDHQQAQDTDPTSLLVMGTATPGLGEFPHFINRDRFPILADHIVSVSTIASAGPFPSIVLKEFDVHVRYPCVAYNGTANTDINENGVYILYFSSEATNGPTVLYQTQLQFVDS